MKHDITEKAMLASLNVSCWCARKHDQRVSKDVDERYGGKDAGRYNKVLASKEAMKDIKAVVNSARTFHLEQTLPWGERGERLLPSKNYNEYSRQMRIYKQQFDDAVEAFVEDYNRVIFDAKQSLGGLFERADYPEIHEIREKFSFRTSISPVPTADDFRVSLGKQEVEAIRQDLEKRLRESYAAATRDLWQRVYEVVNHMASRLSDPDAVFRDSLVGNVVKIAELLPRLNINNDPQLETMRKHIEKNLCAYTPDQLRQDKGLRKQAAGDAGNILDTMAGYMEGECRKN